MKYIIDTDILIYFLKSHKAVVDKFTLIDIDDMATTMINYMELLFGAYNSTQIDKNLTKITSFIKNIEIVNLNRKSAEIFAQLKSIMKKEGVTIADLDLIIASICLANNLILVTNNTKHFKKIKNLKIENWSKF